VTTENQSSPAEFLRVNLSRGLALPAACVEWLMDVFETTQTLDDYADGDPVSRDRLDLLIWRTFVGMPANAWFAQNAGQMIPALASMVLKWQGSDTAERAGQADARSFVWRAGYYDLVLMAVLLTHGEEAARKAAHMVMHLYGERLEDYLAEFKGGSNA
jgi:hypothetical protein